MKRRRRGSSLPVFYIFEKFLGFLVLFSHFSFFSYHEIFLGFLVLFLFWLHNRTLLGFILVFHDRGKCIWLDLWGEALIYVTVTYISGVLIAFVIAYFNRSLDVPYEMLNPFLSFQAWAHILIQKVNGERENTWFWRG